MQLFIIAALLGFIFFVIQATQKKQPSTEEAAMQPGMPFPSMLPVPITERQPDWNVCLAICMS